MLKKLLIKLEYKTDNMNESYLSKLDFILNHICKEVETPKNTFYAVGYTKDTLKSKGLNVTDKEYEELLKKLQDDNYITITHPTSSQLMTIISDGFHLKSTINGLIFNETGYVKKHKTELISEIPKRYWWVIAILAWIFGIAGTILTTLILKQKDQSQPSNQSKQYTQSYVDSLLNSKTVHDTLYLPYDSLKIK